MPGGTSTRPGVATKENGLDCPPECPSRCDATADITRELAPDARALGRSLRIYYGAGRALQLDAFYQRFVEPGDVAFDVGAHVGDRTASFRRLGARVVAVEPQPTLDRFLRRRYGRDSDVTREAVLIGAAPGRLSMWLNRRNPTVSTASSAFITAAKGAEGWRGEVWDKEIELPVTTLDLLVQAHGRPAFIKIDVEGFEAEALRGLSFTPRSLSFEFTTIGRDVAFECLGLLSGLGYRHFNVCLGETLHFVNSKPRDASFMAQFLAALPATANSGDVYASLEPNRITRPECLVHPE
jgi:FkbM family methyltransferase